MPLTIESFIKKFGNLFIKKNEMTSPRAIPDNSTMKKPGFIWIVGKKLSTCLMTFS